uniref:Uncharacterized protein n=1 Tax=Panagrolaimus sp. PS1159 TaxID=55785 RepID=A0AC35FI30_9BILA
MPAIIEDILYDIFCQIGKIPSAKDKSKTTLKESELVKFMMAGKIQMKVSFDFFKTSKAAVLTDKFIEIINDSEKSAAFGNEICQIPSISKLLQQKITKLKCKSLNPNFLPFWDLVKGDITELELNDCFFCNHKLMEALRHFNNLEKAVVSLGIYSFTFIEEISLFCPEMILRVMPFDQIENERFENTRQPNIKNLTVEGHYAINGLQTMSLKRLIRKLTIAFPNLEKLKLVIEDETIENVDAKDVIDLIQKPIIEQNFNLIVIFNFTVPQNLWKDCYFYKTLVNIPEISITDSKNETKCQLLLSDKKFFIINLSSQKINYDNEVEAFSAKRRRIL